MSVMSPEQLSQNMSPEDMERGEAQLLQFVQFVEANPDVVGVCENEKLLEEDGIYLSPSLAEEIGESIKVTKLEPLPGLSLGASDSYHQVGFGRVGLKIGDKIEEIDVAVKPYVEEWVGALHEHDSLVAASERGVDSLAPLGVVKDGDTAYLITAFRPDIMSMDNVDWTIGMNDSDYETEVIPNLNFMARYLALTHASGIFSGDAQPKNCAKNDIDLPVIFDLEGNSICAMSEEEQVVMFNGAGDPSKGLAHEDLSHLWYALTHPIGLNSENIFLGEEPGEVLVEQFEQHILTPYLRELEVMTPPKTFAQFNIEGFVAETRAKVARVSGVY